MFNFVNNLVLYITRTLRTRIKSPTMLQNVFALEISEKLTERKIKKNKIPIVPLIIFDEFIKY